MQRWVRSPPSDQIPSDLVKQLLDTQDHPTWNDQVPVNSFYTEAPKVDDHDPNSTVQIYASSQLQDQAVGFSSISWHEQLNGARCGFEIGSGTLDDHQKKQEALNLFIDSSSLDSSINFASPTNLKAASSFFPQGFFGEEDYSTNFPNTCPSSSDSSTGRLQHIDDLPPRPYTHSSLSDEKATYKLQVSPNEDDDGFQGQTAASKDYVAVDTDKSSSHAGSKRSRSSTNLTTFKVRKEKLGNKINGLQQLVSPFGKTDTASVLHDTIEYIKYLHDQVASHARFDGRAHGHVNRVEASGQDYLKTRGLCLVPISATPDIAKDNPSEFWAATFGGNF